MKKHNIVVGSTNPVKVNAAMSGIEKSFDNAGGFNCIGLDVTSDVSDQPVGDEETKLGAINRARNAFLAYNRKFSEYPEFSIGMEGGVALVSDESNVLSSMECFAWIAVYDGKQFGLSRTASFILPNVIRDLIMEEGMELGAADDKVFGTTNAKQAGGTVGHLTAGVITRSIYYEHAVILAFIPFKWRNLYATSSYSSEDKKEGTGK